jgi:hypothetical protein
MPQGVCSFQLMILPFCATVHAYMYRRHGHGDVELQLVAGTGKRHDYSMHRKKETNLPSRPVHACESPPPMVIPPFFFFFSTVCLCLCAIRVQ